jgi:hypothetical protein
VNKEVYDNFFKADIIPRRARPVARDSVYHVFQSDSTISLHCPRAPHIQQGTVSPDLYRGHCGPICTWSAGLIIGGTYLTYDIILEQFPQHIDGVDGHELCAGLTKLGFQAEPIQPRDFSDFCKLVDDPNKVIIASLLEQEVDDFGFPIDNTSTGSHYVIPLNIRQGNLLLLNSSARLIGSDYPPFGIQEVNLYDFYHEHWYDESDVRGEYFPRCGIVVSL